MIQVGAPAPSFSLPDQDGKAVSLVDLRGRWVVLYFYPRDDTPGCTVEACEFTAALPDFRGLGAVVLGCSSDSAAAHTKFIAKYKLGITLLTDADRTVMQDYGAYGEKKLYGKPVVGVIRSTVLIGPDGNVAHHWATVKAAGHAEQVRARLAALQGGAAPAAKQPAAPKKPTAKKPVAARKAPAKKKPAVAKKKAKK
ncbi:MAG: peroxiredoxin [Planctomycetota bacterium]